MGQKQDVCAQCHSVDCVSNEVNWKKYFISKAGAEVRSISSGESVKISGIGGNDSGVCGQQERGVRGHLSGGREGSIHGSVSSGSYEGLDSVSSGAKVFEQSEISGLSVINGGAEVSKHEMCKRGGDGTGICCDIGSIKYGDVSCGSNTIGRGAGVHKGGGVCRDLNSINCRAGGHGSEVFKFGESSAGLKDM